MTTIQVAALPKQLEFLQAGEREVLYSGAFGAGKTRALCLKLVMRASVPGAIELLCRKHNVTLKRTTLRTLLMPDGDLPPVLPQGSYVHNQSAQTIRIRGGGEIMYFGLDDPDKLGSTPATGVAIDEAVELSEDDYRALRGRIRVTTGGLSNQIYAACNPGAPSHFLAIRFGLAGGHRPADGCRAIRTETAANFFLPPGYLADLNTFTGVAHKRYVLGQWAGSDRLVYDIWDRQIHVKARPGPWRRVVLGVDEGYTNPGCILAVGEDGDGRKHIISESYERRVLSGEWTRRAKSLVEQWAAVQVAVDPSAAGFIGELNAAGIPAIPAENDRRDGVRLVKAALALAKDGEPRLTVDPACSNLVREFETWENKPDEGGRGDEYTKENDHALDALRYAVEFLGEYTAPATDRSAYQQAVRALGAKQAREQDYAGGRDNFDDMCAPVHQNETI